MADRIVALPTSKAFGDDERSVLLGYLAYHRAVLARKLVGLTDAQAHVAALIVPSRLTLLGLVRQITDVERWWFRRVLLADDVPALFDDDEEWEVPLDTTVTDALVAFWDEIAVIDRHLSGGRHGRREYRQPWWRTPRAPSDHRSDDRGYARHCGPRRPAAEVIDGCTGD